MKTSGDFNYYLDNESKTIEEIRHLVSTDMTVSVRGLDVLYFSPKYEINKILDKATKQLDSEILERLKYAKELKDIAIKEEKLSDVDKEYFKVMKESKKVELEMWKKFKQEALEQSGIKDIGFLGFSAKKDKTEELLKEAEEHQEQNGGILEGVEFPFDFTSFTKKNMESYQEMQENVIKGWDKIVLNDSKKQTEGQKHDEGKLPIDIMLTVQFPKAIQAICKATLFGRNKYKETDKDWLNFKRVKGGSTTYANAGQRHNFNKSGKDEQSGLPHIIHKCWNAMAELELWIEENKYEL